MMAHTAFDDDEEFGDEEDGVVTMEVAPSGESSTATGGGSGDEDTRELSFKDLEGELNGETASPAFVGHLHAAAGQRANEGEGASLMADGGGDDDDDRGGGGAEHDDSRGGPRVVQHLRGVAAGHQQVDHQGGECRRSVDCAVDC